MPDPTPEEYRQSAALLMEQAEELPVGNLRRADYVARAQVYATLSLRGPSADTIADAAALLRGAPDPSEFLTHPPASSPPTKRARKPKPADVADALAAEASLPVNE